MSPPAPRPVELSPVQPAALLRALQVEPSPVPPVELLRVPPVELLRVPPVELLRALPVELLRALPAELLRGLPAELLRGLPAELLAQPVECPQEGLPRPRCPAWLCPGV